MRGTDKSSAQVPQLLSVRAKTQIYTIVNLAELSNLQQNFHFLSQFLFLSLQLMFQTLTIFSESWQGCPTHSPWTA